MNTPNKYATDEQKLIAVQQRDKGADDKFFYAVKTTGVYCIPSCPSRMAKPENIIFFDTAASAEDDGYRACKRCLSRTKSRESSTYEKISAACRLIAESDTAIPLKELAGRVNLSHYHFHRLFKKITGVTPKEYASAIRGQKLRNELAPDNSVTEAIYNSGFNSVGRFYEKANELLGMSPNVYKHGGKNTVIYFALGLCSLGDILVAQSNKGVCAIFLGDNPEKMIRDLQDKFSEAELIGGDKNFESVVAQVIGHIENPHSKLDLPLDIKGTAFQQRVWNALRQIPPGKTATYTEIARKIGSPKSVRAVANACGSNSLAVAIPCHRVIRISGELAGYRWGVERKRVLLDRESTL